MARLIHLNGAPGVGKSTIAGRYVADHPGVLNCDIDRLRCLVGGWEADLGAVGAIIRPVALAMIRAHLDEGRDVVLPQMLASEHHRARFRAAAVEGGHEYMHILMQAPLGDVVSRFYARPVDEPPLAVIRAVVDAEGGASAMAEWDRRLEQAASAADAVCIDAGGDIDHTYEQVVAAVAGH